MYLSVVIVRPYSMYGVDQAYKLPLLAGIPGTYQTLEHMAALVKRDSHDMEIRNVALQIVQGCGGHQFGCEITNLFEFVRDHITYRRDPVGQERVQDAKRTLFVFRTGDCDDKVVLLASLLGSLGHRSRFVVLGYSPGNFAHVYLEVETRRGWIPLDPTPERATAGWEASGVLRKTYEIFETQRNGLSPLLLFAAIAGAAWILLRGN